MVTVQRPPRPARARRPWSRRRSPASRSGARDEARPPPTTSPTARPSPAADRAPRRPRRGRPELGCPGIPRVEGDRCQSSPDQPQPRSASPETGSSARSTSAGSEGPAPTVPRPVPRAASSRQVTLDRTFGDFVDAYVELDGRPVRAGTPATSAVDLDTTSWAPGGLAATRRRLRRRQRARRARRCAPRRLLRRPGSVQRGDRPVDPAGPDRRRHARGPSSRPSRVPVARSSRRTWSAARRLQVVGDASRRCPAAATRGLLVDLRVVAGAVRRTAQTTYDVWLAADDPAREQPCAAARRPRARVTPATRPAPRGRLRRARARRSRCGSRCWPALVSVVLAAAVLVVGVATSGASRARDLAGLRIVGVPARDRAVRGGARAPRRRRARRAGRRRRSGWSPRRPRCRDIPLFAIAGRRLPLDARPGLDGGRWSPRDCLVLLCAVSVVVGRALAASADPARLREGR